MRNKSVLALAALCLALVLVLAGTSTARSAGVAAESLSERSPGDVSFLTGPNEGAPLDIIQAYIDSNRSALGLSTADLADVIVTDQYTSDVSGITHIYLRQRYAGIEVFNANINTNVAADGSIINLYSSFVPNLAEAVNTTEPALTAVEAVRAAADQLGLAITSELQVVEAASGADQSGVLSNGGISQLDIPFHLSYQATEKNGLRLAWSASIYTVDGEHWWLAQVDAVTGELLAQVDWVDHDDWGNVADGHGQSQAGQEAALGTAEAMLVPDGYLVYAMPVESPNYASPAPPADARTTEVAPWNDATNASPWGWHDTNGAPGAEFTNTQGNNVDSHKGAVRFDCGPTLECDPPIDLTQDPTIATNVDSATVNLFYWNNIIHDLTYVFGFNEVAGNFQVNNYGRGGLGNDRVNANAQAPGNCNANFGTPPDGSQPTMNMFICNIATPSRDGDLDNGVIAHEYAHGISNRLTGGPGNVSCLNNAEQMGEGWSDWLGLIMTMEVGDAGTDSRGIGTWLLGQGPTGVGVRPTPYSTDMTINPTTYGDIGGLAVPHGVGYAWAGMVWEVVWNLVDDHGFNPDFYGDWTTGGNNLAMQLIMDGMKLQPCSPGFVDGRNAILQADVNLTGGQNQCAIWEGFAKRGLGFSASQGSSSSTTDGTEAFDIPTACSTVGATPATQNICVGDTAVYNVGVGSAYSPPVAMSAGGHPAGTTATFNPNPVNSVPSNTDLTIGNTGSATPGAYTITITGDDGSISDNTTVDLNILNSNPGAPSLVSPPNGANGVGTTAQLSWNAIPNVDDYTVEVATDAGFTNIIYSNTTADTSDSVSGLDVLTTYYWRVRATNACGTGSNSPVWSFTTGEQYCNTTAITIPSSGAGSPYPSNIDISGTGASVVDVNVQLTGLSHTWPDDIDILVVGPQGQNLIIMSDAGGSSDLNNVDLSFDDAAASTLPDSTQISAGTYKPTNYEAGDSFPAPAPAPSGATTLATFNGTDPNGTWSLYVVDDAGGDTGSIAGGWCLEVASVNPTQPDIDVSPASLSSTQDEGTVTVETLTISNNGDADLNWDITEEDTTSVGGNPERLGVPEPVANSDVPEAVNTDVIQDGGFEAGTPNPFWNEASTNFGTPLCTVASCGQGGGTGPHSGTWWSWFGGISGVSETGSVDQTVTIPVGTAFLSFWLEIPVADSTGFLTVDIDGNVLATYTEADQAAYATYQQVTLDVSAYADGGSHNVRFNSTTNAGAGVLNFFIDDVVLDATEQGPCQFPSDIPWLSVAPSNGVITPGNSTAVDVTFDATGLTPGTYTGNLCVNSDDPDPGPGNGTELVIVPVELTVEEAPTSFTIYLPSVIYSDGNSAAPPAAGPSVPAGAPLLLGGLVVFGLAWRRKDGQ